MGGHRGDPDGRAAERKLHHVAGPASILTVGLLLFACGETAPSPFLPGAEGDYLGEAPPDREMRIFAPGVITFGTHEHHLVLTPAADEMLYVIADRYRQHHTIIRVRRQGERWLLPEVAPFSGEYNDFAPTPTPDGAYLLFCSDRPLPGEGLEPGDVNLWRVDRTAKGWGPPYPLPGEVNDDSNEYNPTVALDGTLYFQDHDETGVDIYRAELLTKRSDGADVPDGVYGAPERVEELASPYPEIGPWVFPDGRTLVFSSPRPGGEGDLDFWAAFRGDDGSWSEPLNLGPSINTPSADAIITLSPDGRYFFFTNFRPIDPDRLENRSYEELLRLLRGPENGDGTIYWISSSVLDEARSE